MKVDPRKSDVILVGTSAYSRDSGLESLPAVEQNIRGLGDFLSATGLMGIPEDRILALLNPPDQIEVMEALERAADLDSDVLIFYYSGHGLLDQGGILHLSMSRSTQVGAHYDALSWDLIRAAIARSTAALRIVILDCCFSGRAVQAMSATETVAYGQVDIDGAVIFTSSPANAPSMAPIGERYTAFTGAVLEVLHSGVAEVDSPHISIREIFEQTRRILQRNSRPRPQLNASNAADAVGLFPNLAYVVPSFERARRTDWKMSEETWHGVRSVGLLDWGTDEPLRWRDGGPCPRFRRSIELRPALKSSIEKVERDVCVMLGISGKEHPRFITDRIIEIHEAWVHTPERASAGERRMIESAHITLTTLKRLYYKFFDLEPPVTFCIDMLITLVSRNDQLARELDLPTTHVVEGAVLLAMMESEKRSIFAQGVEYRIAMISCMEELDAWRDAGFSIDFRRGFDSFKVDLDVIRSRVVPAHA